MSCAILLPVIVTTNSILLPINITDNSILLGKILVNCGTPGKSAYAQAVAGGYTNTESAFNTNLAKIDDTTEKAETAVQPEDLPNITPTIGESGNWFVGTEDTGVQAKGQDGANLVTMSATTSISFTALYVVMNQATLSENTVFTPVAAGAVSGSWVQQSVIIGATGISIQFDGFRKTANSCPVNAIVGEVYLLDFRYKDGNFWVTVSNENSDLAKKSETVTPAQAQTIAEQVVYNVVSQAQDETYANLGFYGIQWNDNYNNSGCKRRGTLAAYAGGGYYGEVGYATTTVPFSNIPDSQLFVHNKIKSCILNDDGSINYYLDPSNNFNRENVAPSILGTATSTSALKIVCAGLFTLSSDNYVGHYIHNTSSGKTNYYALITAKDSNNQLTIDTDIFISGDTFEICTAALDGSAGQAMVRIPKFYIRQNYDNGVNQLDISLYKYNGFSTHPAFVENGIEKDAIFIGKFGANLNGAKLESRAGIVPTTSLTRAQFRTYAKNRTGWCQLPFWYQQAIMCLFYTEFADLNSQLRLPGYAFRSQFLASYVRKNGRTLQDGNYNASIVASSLYDSDIINDSYWSSSVKTIANSYRGIENFYGSLWQFLDGINIYDRNVYVTNNRNSFADDSASNYVNTGLSLPVTDGWIKTVHPSVAGSFIPKTVGGASNYNFSDSVWQADGWRVALAGGSLYFGAFAGVASLPANNASSYASTNLGARLCF